MKAKAIRSAVISLSLMILGLMAVSRSPAATQGGSDTPTQGGNNGTPTTKQTSNNGVQAPTTNKTGSNGASNATTPSNTGSNNGCPGCCGSQ